MESRQPAGSDGYALELRRIVKQFPGVLANDHVNVSVFPGQIHALLGENGAGKTTLMSILYGLYQPDEGEIYVRGERVHFRSPLDAIAAGLGMVHQSFKLFPSMTVAENVIYRSEPQRGGFVDRTEAIRGVASLAERFGLRVNPRVRVGDLPVGVRQRVEILKLLYRNADILILDEPTGVLTPQERDALFEVLRNLVASGKTVVFITHKLQEVMRLADRVTILRDGRVVADLERRETTPEEITHHLTGRDLQPMTRRAAAAPGAVMLSCEDVTVHEGGLTVVDGASLNVREGEIVGIAGVAGNGQSELIEAITGLRKVTRGRISVGGVDVTTSSVAERREAGLAYIPEDRNDRGTAPAAEVSENMAFGSHRRPPFVRRGRLQWRAIMAHARSVIGKYGVRAASPRANVGTLSGGNVQKLVVARELEYERPVLIAEQPTRGLDVGATEFVHNRLIEARNQGRAILLVSAELSEILTLSDRILVAFEGRIVADMPSAEASERKLGLLMAGGTPAGVAS